MLKMTIDNEEVLSDNDISIKEEILSPSSTILNNVYPKSWELDKDYTSRFYYPKDYSKLNIQNFSIEPEEAGKTIQVNGSATLTDVDTSKESRVLRILGQTSQTGTPTPSSPIPVNVVSGDNTINICGKNLLKFDNSQNTDKRLWSYTTETPELIVCSKVSDGGSFYAVYETYVEENQQYTISVEDDTNRNLYCYKDVIWGIAVSGLTNKNINKTTSLTFTSSYTGKMIVGFFTSDATKTLTKPQIEKGSTATSYVPHIGSSYPLYLGVENLFDKSTANLGKGVGTSNGNLYNDSALFATDFIEVKTGGVYYTTSGYSTSANRIYGAQYDSNKQYVGSIVTNAGTKTFYISNASTKYIRLTGFISDIDTYQLEEGSKANSYTPYGTTPIELCKIGTYQDYIYKDNGSWYLHKEIGKVVLDGTETGWGMSAWGTSPYKRMSRDLADIKQVPDSEFTQIYSNEFRAGKYNDGSLNTITSRGSLHQLNLWQDVATTNLNAWLTWLASNNLIVYYQLATPTNTEITDTTLLEQLESLSS